jgi:hypothetical protein
MPKSVRFFRLWRRLAGLRWRCFSPLLTRLHLLRLRCVFLPKLLRLLLVAKLNLLFLRFARVGLG